ncbi:hypothetical protein [Streptomyces silaceus]|uniref:hypothetical protein n=1 Tax=Streptomyces silaceus TaxID=545123 RepID=UPI00114D0AC9|nr:hypothetical protein [Streptomyces silaceus]
MPREGLSAPVSGVVPMSSPRPTVGRVSLPVAVERRPSVAGGRAVPCAGRGASGPGAAGLVPPREAVERRTPGVAGGVDAPGAGRSAPSPGVPAASLSRPTVGRVPPLESAER